MASLRARKAGTKYKYFVTKDPETWTLGNEVQREVFDDSWKEVLHEKDEGWQQVERRGTGRLAGGGGTHRKPTPTAPRNFGKQQTMDSFLAEMGPRSNRDGLTPEQLREAEELERQAAEEWQRMENEIRANMRIQPRRPTSLPPSPARRANPST